MVKSPLKLARLSKAMTQFELSKQVGCSEKLISMFETTRSVPLPDMRHRLAKILETTPEQLFPECY